jgi:Zn-finger nucleic acid-binding protein
MRCASCNQPIDPNDADDRGLLRCACGATIEIEERRKVRTPIVDDVRVDAPPTIEGGDPYRSPAAATPRDGAVPLDLASHADSHARTHASTAAPTQCPRCGRPLRPLATESSCHGCEACGGVFVEIEALRRPREELSGVVEPRASAPAMDVSPYLRCPMCDEMMARTVFGRRSGVVVDVCRAHGTWFDHGELVRALEFVERGGLDETRRAQDAERAAIFADAAARRATAEIDAALLVGAARDARRLGRWEGMLAARKRTLLDVLIELLG